MRVARWVVAAAFMLAALSGCYIIFNFDPVPSVELTASSTWIVTGETSILTANAYDLDGDTLSYEWYENGVLIPGVTGSALTYWRAVEEREYVTVTVVVRDGSTGYGIDSVDITVDPRSDGAILVVNNSSIDIWYVYDRKYPYTKWSSDRLGADIIPAHSRYLIINHDLYGYSTGYWDLKVEDDTNTFLGEQDDIYLSPGKVYEFILTD